MSGSDVLLESGTGGLKLRRFVAQRGQATASGTGCIEIGALYGEGVALSTGEVSLGCKDSWSGLLQTSEAWKALEVQGNIDCRLFGAICTLPCTICFH